MLLQAGIAARTADCAARSKSHAKAVRRLTELPVIKLTPENARETKTQWRYYNRDYSVTNPV